MSEICIISETTRVQLKKKMTKSKIDIEKLDRYVFSFGNLNGYNF